MTMMMFISTDDDDDDDDDDDVVIVILAGWGSLEASNFAQFLGLGLVGNTRP